MKILYNKTNGNIMTIAHRFSYGVFDEPNVEKWAMYDEEDNIQNVFYLGHDLISSDINTEDIPEDWGSGKYLFINGEFELNPNWHEPEPPIEERVSTLEDNITNIELALTDIVDLLSE